MLPVKVKGETNSFKKPADWDDKRDGQCGDLSVRREIHGEHVYHYSAWKPSADELATLNAGGVVELCCVSIQPPVAVGVVENAG